MLFDELLGFQRDLTSQMEAFFVRISLILCYPEFNFVNKIQPNINL